MKTSLVCFATRNFYRSQRRLYASAIQHGINSVHTYNMWDLRRTAFYRRFKHILRAKRGAGYFLWKPYLILETLKRANIDEIILYADSGIEISADVEPLLKLCGQTDDVLLFQTHGQLNRMWTKRDCFFYMGCDSREFYDAEQSMGGFQVYRNGPQAVEFVEEWLQYCEDERILTDAPNTCGLPNLPEFREHRWDQSVLSLIALKRKKPVLRDPSQWGNHMKMPEFRVAGEWLPAPYSAHPYLNSPYPTLLNLHRQQQPLLSSRVKRKLAYVMRSRLRQ